MNRLHIFGMMALAVAGLTSCEPDDSPKLQEPTEFVLNTPPFASELYALQRNHTVTLTCSQPDYGLTLAPAYSIEVSLLKDFGEATPAPEADAEEDVIPTSVTITPDDPYSATIELKDQAISDAILKMRGIEEEAQYTPWTGPLYVRAIASVNSQAITTIKSNVVTLAQVSDYFSLEAELPLLYTPGNSNGWNFDASMNLLGYEKDEATGEWTKFHGLVYLDGDFKFTSKPGWDGVNYGDSGTEGTLSTDGGAKNLKLPATGAGLYFAEVNVETLKYTLVYISSFGLIGDFTGWDPNAPIDMTPSADYKTWTYTGDFTEGGFKIILNGPETAWTYNYGAPADNLTFNGGNLSITGGSHTVTVDLSKIPYTATIE